MQIFNFHGDHVTTFWHPSGTYICQMPGHRLSRLAKGTPSRVSAFHWYQWFGVKLFPVRRIVEGTPKTRKNAVFLDLALPKLQNSKKNFTIASFLTSLWWFAV